MTRAPLAAAAFAGLMLTTMPAVAQSGACLVDVQMTYTSAVEQVVAFRGLTTGDRAIHPEEPKRGDRAQCFILDGCLVQAEIYSAASGGSTVGQSSSTESQADGVRCTIAKAN